MMRLTIQVSTGKLWAFVIALCMLLIMSCDAGAEDSPTDISDIRVMKTELGEILTDGNGRTLYIFARDVKGNTTCTGDCLNMFSAFSVNNFSVSSSLASEYFATINSHEGKAQVTYKGWPLYYFTYDYRIGDMKADGRANQWFIAKPDYDVMIAEATIGVESIRYLVDDFGNALYRFTEDGNNQRNCSDDCLTTWPVFNRSEPILPSTLDSTDFGVIKSEEAKQSAFKQRPLYYFINDHDPGDINGHGVGDLWFLEDIQ